MFCFVLIRHRNSFLDINCNSIIPCLWIQTIKKYVVQSVLITDIIAFSNAIKMLVVDTGSKSRHSLSYFFPSFLTCSCCILGWSPATSRTELKSILMKSCHQGRETRECENAGFHKETWEERGAIFSLEEITPYFSSSNFIKKNKMFNN